MLQGITNKREIADCLKILKGKLKEVECELIRIRYSSRAGIGEEEEANYSQKHDLWWVFSGNGTQYWNPFGIGKPKKGGTVTGRCQINMPHEGYNARIAGGFARDIEGNIYLLHNGAIGGGKSGIGQAQFLQWFDGELWDVRFGSKLSKYYVIANLSLPDIHDHIEFFVRAVYKFKERASESEIYVHRSERLLSDEESLVRNPYLLPEKTILRGCEHSKIMRALKDQLQVIGVNTMRTSKIDLLVTGNDGKYLCIFEIKFDLTTQSLYTAIGQLMVYGLNHPNAIKFLVIEDKYLKSICDDLRRIEIVCLGYSMKGTTVKFNLDPLHEKLKERIKQ